MHENLIAQIENIRWSNRLNKAQFCVALGMSPQTYNNFTGKQNSKPNVALLIGLRKAFDVDLNALIDGLLDAEKQDNTN